MQGRSPIGANLRRIISLSVVIVRAHADDPVSTERRIWHGFTLNPLSRDYWVPRLKRGMTTERFVARLKLAPMGLDPRAYLLPDKLPLLAKKMDCIGPRACPRSAHQQSAASRVYPTCGVKPGNDERSFADIGEGHAVHLCKTHSRGGRRGSLRCARRVAASSQCGRRDQDRRAACAYRLACRRRQEAGRRLEDVAPPRPHRRRAQAGGAK